MKNSAVKDIENLQKLLQKKSKHSNYQSIHPSILSMLDGELLIPSGKAEFERYGYMKDVYDFSCKKIIDIGANTGYFTFSAISDGASHVEVYEGNIDHANFIEVATAALRISHKNNVNSKYFDFKNNNDYKDVIFCLNVLHHLGDDFGDSSLKIEEAKIEISNAIKYLSNQCDNLWLQLGFNWKGNKLTPLFENGSKREIIDFVAQSCYKHWNIESVGIYNPKTKKYENSNNYLMERFEEIGEFLNRPIFLLNKIGC